jgi:hypothetical protein
MGVFEGVGLIACCLIAAIVFEWWKGRRRENAQIRRDATQWIVRNETDNCAYQISIHFVRTLEDSAAKMLKMQEQMLVLLRRIYDETEADKRCRNETSEESEPSGEKT